ncbi:glycoside hydrolase superfamily [Podospora appendiculata]|uniref:Glycoside hydrolase superfamily n=1 Tax=Podospora appendiculata TaxID=314037 RepID=A0AAE1CGI6_9PEZI|nr:glycoside hydrolase superfamily [Podospora appendiculata]
MFTESLLVAALAATQAWAAPQVNVYFGQTGPDSLGSYCETTGFEIVTLAFVNNSPEKDPSGLGYPGTNFAAHCAGDVYMNGVKSSNLLSQCTFIADDIAKCQSLGKKVLLSVGGEFRASSNYTVSTEANGIQFAEFLWGAFGPYSASWNGVRPFDFNGKHAFVNGFDFDIETKFPDTSGYVAMVNRLRDLYKTASGTYLVTAAPECPLDTANFKMKGIIDASIFDALFIQFYNNAGCSANNAAGFNYLAWESYIATSASKNAKLYIGLPGSPGSAGAGYYLEPAAAASLVSTYKDRASFGGVMLWDVYTASNKTNGKTYYQYLHDVLIPTTTSSATTTTTSTPTASPTACVKTVTVQGGDSCWLIANNNDLTVDQLKALNPGLDCALQPGQVLCIKFGIASSTSSSIAISTTTSVASSTTSSASVVSSSSSSSSAVVSSSSSIASSTASSSAISSSSSVSSAVSSSAAVSSSLLRCRLQLLRCRLQLLRCRLQQRRRVQLRPDRVVQRQLFSRQQQHRACFDHLGPGLIHREPVGHCQHLDRD